MIRPLTRIGILLVISTIFLFWIAGPGLADVESDVSSGAVENPGRGMNRLGGPSFHPGNGWMDPGQVQGSINNLADPDCTGNRTVTPQATNVAACDDPSGAADEMGGPGGFDADKDWNNGCGNDIDFEDDNNGQCRGKTAPTSVGKPVPEPEVSGKEVPGPTTNPPTASGKFDEQPPKAGGIESATLPVVRPARVLSERITQPAPVPAGQRLPITGLNSMDLLFVGIACMAIGRKLLMKSRPRGG